MGFLVFSALFSGITFVLVVSGLAVGVCGGLMLYEWLKGE